MSLNVSVSRLASVVKVILLSNVLAVGVGIVTLPWRSELIAALDAFGVPQPSPIETIGLFVLTVAFCYIFASLAEAEMAQA